MNHELQPQTQLAEATPQMQPESRNFMQSVLARGRYALAIGGSALIAGGVGAYKSHEAKAAGPTPDWPPITMTPESEGYSQALADDCKYNLPSATSVVTKPWRSSAQKTFRLAKGSRTKGAIFYNLNDVSYCDSYGKRTSISYLQTRRPGTRFFTKGASVIDRTNEGKNNVGRMFGLGQRCVKGMVARYVTESRYVDYTGKVRTVNRYVTLPEKIDCTFRP